MIRKIIASDIDGTLLPFGQKSLDPKLFELIRLLKEEGVLFIPASGRTIQSLMSLFTPVVDDISFLSENGGVIWNGKIPIAETPLPKELLFEIAQTIYDNPLMQCYMTSIDRGFVYTDDPGFVDYFNKNVLPGSEYLASLDDLEETPVKITAFCAVEADLFVPEFKDKFGGRIHVMQAGPDVVDFGIANKGFGLKILTEYHSLTPEDVYAFGDNYNDKSMLEYAHNSYIMRTEDPVLLKSARYVCDDVIAELEKIYHELKSSDSKE